MSLACPVCLTSPSDRFCRLGDRFFQSTEELFQLYRCTSCGLVFQDGESVRSQISDFYPVGYWWRQDRGLFSKAERTYREWMVRLDQLAFIKKAFADRDPSSVRLLDVGTGNGLLVRLALEAGYDAYGLELSRLADPQPPDRVFIGNPEDVIAQAEDFDLVTLFHCLEHVPSPRSYLTSLKPLIRPTGCLVLQVPNLDSLQAQLCGEGWYGLDCPRHLSNFGPQSLTKLLSVTGFEVQRMRYFSLRDNAAAFVSSLFPTFDPMSQRSRLMARSGAKSSLRPLKQLCYLFLVVLAQPLAVLEAALGRGGTMTLQAKVSDNS